MEKKKKGRGRPSGESTLILIKDPLLEPFHITKDNYNFTVVESVKSTRGFGGKEPSGKVNEKVVGYYSKISYALKAIAKEKSTSSTKKSFTLQEYVDSLREIESNINKVLNKIEV